MVEADMSDTRDSCQYWLNILCPQPFLFAELPEELQRKILFEVLLDDFDSEVQLSVQYSLGPGPVYGVTASDIAATPKVKYSYRLPKAVFLVNKFFYQECKELLSKMDCSLGPLHDVRAIQQQPYSATRDAFNKAVQMVDCFNLGYLCGSLKMVANSFPNASIVRAQQAGLDSLGLGESRIGGASRNSQFPPVHSVARVAVSKGLMSLLRGDHDQELAHLFYEKMSYYLPFEDHKALRALTLHIPYRISLSQKAWEEVYAQYDFPGSMLVIVAPVTRGRTWVEEKHFAKFTDQASRFQWNVHDTEQTEPDAAEGKEALPAIPGVASDVVEGIPRPRHSGWCGTSIHMEYQAWYAS